MAIHLCTPYYRDALNSLHQKEIDDCIRRNLELTSISKIHLLIDDGSHPPYSGSKIDVIRITSRPTFLNWIEIRKSLNPLDICVLANSDIYFDESLQLMEVILDDPGKFVALSRRERVNGRLPVTPDPEVTQDVWAMRADAFISDQLSRSLDFSLGIPRCDNHAAFLFAVHGWQIYNPANFIRAVHVHESAIRAYKSVDYRILGGVAFVKPSSSLTSPTLPRLQVWSRSTVAGPSKFIIHECNTHNFWFRAKNRLRTMLR